MAVQLYRILYSLCSVALAMAIAVRTHYVEYMFTCLYLSVHAPDLCLEVMFLYYISIIHNFNVSSAPVGFLVLDIMY